MLHEDRPSATKCALVLMSITVTRYVHLRLSITLNAASLSSH